MSEKLHGRHESQDTSHNEVHKRREQIREEVEKKAEASRHTHAEKIDEIRSKVESEARASKEEGLGNKEAEKQESDQPMLVNKDLKDMAYRRTLKRTQSKLPAPARVFSKFIHQPAVEAASEFAGKTVARPSGVLAGGIFAFLGSSLFLWISRHYGYEYNFLLFALCFVGGFFVGLGVELGIKAANRKT